MDAVFRSGVVIIPSGALLAVLPYALRRVLDTAEFALDHDRRFIVLPFKPEHSKSTTSRGLLIYVLVLLHFCWLAVEARA